MGWFTKKEKPCKKPQERTEIEMTSGSPEVDDKLFDLFSGPIILTCLSIMLGQILLSPFQSSYVWSFITSMLPVICIVIFTHKQVDKLDFPADNKKFDRIILTTMAYLFCSLLFGGLMINGYLISTIICIVIYMSMASLFTLCVVMPHIQDDISIEHKKEIVAVAEWIIHFVAREGLFSILLAFMMSRFMEAITIIFFNALNWGIIWNFYPKKIFNV